MTKKIQQSNRRLKRAFTLTELLIIIAVIGILAAIIIPSFFGVEDKAESKSDENTIEVINTALDNAQTLKKDVSTLSAVKTQLRGAGFYDDKLKPQNEGEKKNNERFCFVWDQSLNAVLMINLYNDEVIYPQNLNETINDGDWYFVEKTPTDDDDCLYPSEIGYARKAFDEVLNDNSIPEASPERNSLYAIQVKLPSFEYDGETYERPSCVAWALFDKDATYPNGATGRLGDVILSRGIDFSNERKSEEGEASTVYAFSYVTYKAMSGVSVDIKTPDDEKITVKADGTINTIGTKGVYVFDLVSAESGTSTVGSPIYSIPTL